MFKTRGLLIPHAKKGNHFSPKLRQDLQRALQHHLKTTDPQKTGKAQVSWSRLHLIHPSLRGLLSYETGTFPASHGFC